MAQAGEPWLFLMILFIMHKITNSKLVDNNNDNNNSKDNDNDNNNSKDNNNNQMYIQYP